MSKLDGTIKITRLGSKATIEIRDDLSREIFLTIDIADFELMQAIQGGRSQPCEFVTDHLEHIGLCYQEKTMHITPPSESPSDAEWEEALSEHEQHDWKGELGDCGNPQRTVRGGAQAVRFYRYVKPEEVRPCRRP